MRLILGDCLEVLPTLPAASVDAVVCDPPAGIEFMGKAWDNPATWADAFGPSGAANPGARSRLESGRSVYGNPTCETCHRGKFLSAARKEAGKLACQCAEPDFSHHQQRKQAADLRHRVRTRELFVAFLAAALAECLRVAKPGARLLCWAIPRTSHWTGTAVEDAGWVIEDRISHLFGCLSEDTEILTERGWEPYHKIETGSLALAYNADGDSFQWEPIKEVLVYDYRDTAYRILSDHTDQIVSRNHRCLVERGGGYAFQYAETLAAETPVPVLEGVQSLLEALPLPERYSGSPQRGLLASVRGRTVQERENWEAAWPKSGMGDAALCLLPQRENGAEEGRAGEEVFLQPQLSREDVGDGKRHGGNGLAGQGRLDRGGACVLSGEDERPEQPGVEGRGDGLQNARPVRRGEVCPLPGRVSADGPQGRLCDGTPADRCGNRRPVSAASGSGSPRQPRPAGQHTVQPDALCEQPGPQAVRASRFTRADLSRVIPFHYEGKVWCVRVPSGAFVARRAGKVFVTGNSGFPKAKSKLKPACEDWWLARKPSRGVPPLQIDACRVGYGDKTMDEVRREAGSPGLRTQKRDCYEDGWSAEPEPVPFHPAGRWPANLVLSHHAECRRVGTRRVKGTAARGRPSLGQPRPHGACYGAVDSGRKPTDYADADGLEAVEEWRCVESCPVRQLDAQSGTLVSNGGRPQRAKRRASIGYGGSEEGPDANLYGDSGGASRFFYVAKASRKDRGEGNDHPTVKSTALMRWLCRLVTPPGGVVLDPFAGSASTGIACAAEGFDFVGIEQDASYHAIAQRRLADARGPLFAEAAHA